MTDDIETTPGGKTGTIDAAPATRPVRKTPTFAIGLTLIILILAAGAAAWIAILEPLERRVALIEGRQGDDAALAARIGALEAASRRPGDQGPAGDDRIAALESEIADIKQGAAETGQIARRLSDLQLAAGGRELLAQSIRDIQSTTAETQGAVERLGAQMAALGARVDQLEAAQSQRRQQGLKAEAVVLAVGQLRAALRQSKPFMRDLDSVRALVGADPEMVAVLDQLQPIADEGAPSHDELRESFARLAPEIVRSAVVGDGAHWWRQALYHIETVVSIRRVGEGVAGDEVDAIVARAQAKLEQDDLKGAIAGLKPLSGLPAELAAPWVRDAGQRAIVDQAEADLTRLAIERVSEGHAEPTPAPAPAVSQ